MAKKTKKKSSKKNYSPQELKHARAIAAGLEASFTDPPPPGAMAPAPLIDEIREMGEVGVAGMLEHLAATAPEGRAASLSSIRELGDAAAVPGLLERVGSLRWAPDDLFALRETIQALDAGVKIPVELDGDAIARARKVAEDLADADRLSDEAAGAISEILDSLPDSLREVALRDAFSGESAGSVRVQAAIALADAFAARGSAPPPVLIDAMTAEATTEAVEGLSRLADSVKDKAAGSRIRKALFRLRGKGVALEEDSSSIGPRLASHGLDYVKAIVSSVDGAGNLILWIARSRQPRGRSIFQARLRHGRGIQDFVSTDMSAKELREFFGRLTQDQRLPSVEVPAGYAFWLLQRGQQENESGGGSAIPQGFTHSRILLAPLADPEVFPFPGDHPVRALVQPASGEDGRIDHKDIFGNSAFWAWVIEEGLIVPHFQKCVEALQSQVATDDEQRRILFDKAIEEAASELYKNTDLLRRLSYQLEDNAYLLHQQGEAALASEIISLADRLREGGPQPDFFTEVVRYSIGAMLERAIRQSQEAQGQGHDHDHDHGHEHGEESGGPEPGGSEPDSPTIITP